MANGARVLLTPLPLQSFMTSLYCEDDLDEGAFEVGIEAIRAARVHVEDEDVVAALRAVVEAKVGDGRRRKAKQLRAALDYAVDYGVIPAMESHDG